MLIMYYIYIMQALLCRTIQDPENKGIGVLEDWGAGGSATGDKQRIYYFTFVPRHIVCISEHDIHTSNSILLHLGYHWLTNLELLYCV